MFAALRCYGPDLLRDLAWKTPERWRHYEARYGVERDDAGPGRDDGPAAAPRRAAPVASAAPEAGVGRSAGI